MRKPKDRLLAALCAAVILLSYVGYSNFISQKIYEESSSHLVEVYSHLDHAFSSLTERNWHLLSDWSSYVQQILESGRQDELEGLIQGGKENWGYTQFHFQDDEGNYCTLNGTRGRLTLSHQVAAPAWESDRAVVNGTLSSGETVTAFVMYMPAGQYRGFDFSSIVVCYNNQAMEQVLDMSAFDHQASSYVVARDGDTLFSSVTGEERVDNYLDLLERSGDFLRGDIQTLRADIAAGAEGVMQYRLDGKEYYMAYQPMGAQLWVMLGVVPVDLVNGSINQVQWVTMALMAVIFLIAAAMIVTRVQDVVRSRLRKQALEIQYRDLLFRTLVTHTVDIFVMFSAGNYEVDYVSPNIEGLLGLPAEELKQNIRRLSQTAVEQSKLYSREELAAIPLGESRQDLWRRIHQKTGEEHWYQETIYHLMIDDMEKYILVMSDHTPERQSQAQLEQALDIAKSANEAKSAFLSNMSHDIRTPMNAIMGFAALLDRDAAQPDKVREYTRKISAAGDHLLSLINDILDMSKIESGKTSLNVAEFKLSELLEGLKTVFQPQVQAKGQTFNIKVRKVQHDRLMGDQLRINQILQNLISNAIKYTPEGGEIELYVIKTQAARNYSHLRFQVRDNGMGMSPEYLKTIFDPFSRERNSTISGIQGTGLGMSITKNLVDLMGGTISVESRQGEGSTFTVELRLRIAEHEEELDFWKKHGISRILLVDDEEDACKNIQYLMENSGVEVSYTTNNRTAARLAHRAAENGTPYNLILLDWIMPGMDGAEAARRIRAGVDSKTTPMLVLSPYDWSEIEEDALRSGANGFLSKPFFLSNLQQAVRQMKNDKKHEQRITAEPVSLSGLHFLVAEDNDINAEILTELLDMEGATCEVAENGQAALERFQKSKPRLYDMILMDIQMPVMDGYSAARAIRACDHPEAQTIPIAAMTANAFAEDVQRAMAAGMDAHIGKPVDMDVLASTVIKLLSQGRGRAETQNF